jgi:hypothetical protein
MSSRITPRTPEAIRASLLARFQAAMRGQGIEHSIDAPGELFLRASAIGVVDAGAEQRADGAFNAVLPDKAIADSLRHHGAIYELARVAGETDHAFADRVLIERRVCLGSGSPADWVRWAKAFGPDVPEAYWYSRIAPGTTTSTLGTGIICLLGPPQGDSPFNSRISSVTPDVADWLDGFNGNRRERPVTTRLAQSGFFTDGVVGVETVTTVVQNIAFSVRNTSAFEFPWQPYTGLAIVGATTTDVTVAGDRSALEGLPMLLNVGTGNARGGYVKATPVTAVFGGVNTVFHFSPALVAAPSGTVYPAPANWHLLRAAIFGVVDALGPGDTSPSRRYPPVNLSGDPVLRLSAIGKAVMGTVGVVSMNLTGPVANVTPAAKQIVELGTLTITRT